MITKKQTQAKKYLEKLRGGPLTFGKLLKSIREADDYTQVQMAKNLEFLKHIFAISKKVAVRFRRNALQNLPKRWVTQLNNLLRWPCKIRWEMPDLI